jgi:hypothetical protein
VAIIFLKHKTKEFYILINISLGEWGDFKDHVPYGLGAMDKVDGIFYEVYLHTLGGGENFQDFVQTFFLIYHGFPKNKNYVNKKDLRDMEGA